MRRPRITALLIVVLFVGCSNPKEETLAAFDVFCEMVANEAKPVALGHPMNKEILDDYWIDFESTADKYGVLLYREPDFPVTELFPASVTKGKEVPVIYKEARLTQYHQFKKDLDQLDKREAARRFGRLLGYTVQGINELLMKNTDYRSLASFDVNQQITHLYYADAAAAHQFYLEVLGLTYEEEKGFQVGVDAFIQVHAANDEHPAQQPKSTAIAFLTDQLPEWYAHIQEQVVPIKYTYKPRDGGPHDGFVAIDPGGHLLEFEQFKQHPENELFMAVLESAPRLQTSVDQLNFYGSITWTYHNDLLQMQHFYEEVLGYRLVADQGWTKIYQTSSAGFIGLVDERRGMMDYADEKAIEIEWQLDEVEEAINYFGKQNLIGPEKYIYRLR